MKASLEKLLNNNQLYKEMSDNLFNYISKNYDIKSNAKKLLLIIKNIK
jgi:glycosyltransferase involved in cell wall biosynthesis